VTFDDQKTTVEAMEKALAKEHFPVEGEVSVIK
jgi:hypothetical protein